MTDHPFPDPPEGRLFGVAREATGLERLRRPTLSTVTIRFNLPLADANQIAMDHPKDAWVFAQENTRKLLE